MNCGLGNLDSLKKHLLAQTLAGETRFDLVIKDIGLGVARRFDRFCNRTIAYFDHATEIFSGDRDHWYMSRYPFISIEKVELRFFAADNWTNISGQPVGINEETGLLHFNYTLGVRPMMVRVTWSGGYWYEQLEPDDAAYPSSAPAAVQAATSIEPAKFALPDDLRLAWLMQCRHLWDSVDKLGTSLVDKPGQQSAMGALELVPDVKETLQRYVRYQTS